ncbi:MAG: helix-turn-helix domain-containing protein [Bacteroidales bacterium]|nr:helix-turn-helix domain-containing protein [Bacteroidales bacterium]
MEEKKYFLNPKFTIEDCAKELHTNRKYISQVINESLEINFNNFVNEYRVKEVRKFLINPEYNNYSLNGIASMAGFHSRATFNSAFKKFTGLTPSYFKKKNN